MRDVLIGVSAVGGIFLATVVVFLAMMSLYYRARHGRFSIVENSSSRFVARTDVGRVAIHKEQHGVEVESGARTRMIPFDQISKIAYRYWANPRGWGPTDWYEISLVLKNGEKVKVYVAGQGARPAFQQELQAWEFAVLSKLGLVRDVEQSSRYVLETVRQAFLDAGLELHLA